MEELPNEIATKKTIVVVGHMGHGKSAFVKMLATDEEKHKIRVSAGIKSVTTECYLYKVNPSLNLWKDSLYILDTPGLNSQATRYILLQNMEYELLNQHCQIVAIVFILSANEGRVGEEIYPLFNQIKLRHSVKRHVMFCVLTKYDKFLKEDQEDIQLILAQLEQEFISRKIHTLWNNRIPWVSCTENGESKFQKIKNNHQEPAHSVYINQWKRLQNNLERVISQGFYQSYQNYEKDILIFDELTSKHFKGMLLNQFESALYKREFTFIREIVESKKKNPLAACIQAYRKRWKESALVHKIYMSLPLFSLPYILYNYFKTGYELKIENKLANQQQKLARLQNKITAYQQKLLTQQICLDEVTGEMTLKKEPWFEKIKVSRFEDSIQIQSIILESDEPTPDSETFRVQEPVSKYKFMVNVMTPRPEEFQLFLNKLILDYYQDK